MRSPFPSTFILLWYFRRISAFYVSLVTGFLFSFCWRFNFILSVKINLNNLPHLIYFTIYDKGIFGRKWNSVKYTAGITVLFFFLVTIDCFFKDFVSILHLTSFRQHSEVHLKHHYNFNGLCMSLIQQKFLNIIPLIFNMKQSSQFLISLLLFDFNLFSQFPLIFWFCTWG